MRGQLGLATEALAVRHGAPAPVVGSGLDEIALELSQPAQDRHHQPAMRCCGVDPSVGQRLRAGALPRNGVERVEYDLRKLVSGGDISNLSESSAGHCRVAHTRQLDVCDFFALRRPKKSLSSPRKATDPKAECCSPLR